MRVMVLVKATAGSEAGQMPKEDLLARMVAYNEELAEAGVILGGDGLRPSSAGVRIRFGTGGPTEEAGPFRPAEELVAGYWIWKVDSVDEAVAWARRAPFDSGEVLEIRPLSEPDDFGEEFTPELRQREEGLARRLREGDA